MAEIEDNTIARQQLIRFPTFGEEQSGRFCMVGVMNYVSEDPAINTKRDQLLEALRGEFPGRVSTLECTIGGCDKKITTDLDKGSVERTGVCKAASYCIKESFDAVATAETTELGRELYRDLMNTCEGASSKYSAGNFCPRVDCDMSAGVSVDMVPGTYGECRVEMRSSQMTLDIPTEQRML